MKKLIGVALLALCIAWPALGQFITPGAPLTMNQLASFLNTAFSNTMVTARLIGLNFNSANTDSVITISLPSGRTRYWLNQITISGASGSLTNATIGVFTAPGGGGVTVAPQQAITVSTGSNDVANNTQNIGVNGYVFSDTTLYVHIGAAEGSPATANVALWLRPEP